MNKKERIGYHLKIDIACSFCALGGLGTGTKWRKDKKEWVTKVKN